MRLIGDGAMDVDTFKEHSFSAVDIALFVNLALFVNYGLMIQL